MSLQPATNSDSIVDTPKPAITGTIDPVDLPNFTALLMYNANLHDFYITSSGSLDPLFYFPIRLFKTEFPMHAGDATGPIVGVGRIMRWRETMFGLGDPANESRVMLWEKMSLNLSWAKEEYSFDFLFGEEGRTGFVWTRTRFRPFKGEMEYVLMRKDEPGMVLARYQRSGALIKRSKIRQEVMIRKEYGDAWEAIVLLTLVTILESMRRRK